MLELVSPSTTYKDSYLKALKEYQQEGLEHYQPLDEGELRNDFEGYVQKLLNQAQGRDLPEGFVPHSELWLVDNNEFIGRVDIRHQLNDYLKNIGGHIGYDIRPSKRHQGYGKKALELGLRKAHELGIKEVLMTCDATNLGSNKIIQANGGVIMETKNRPGTDVIRNRYLINFKDKQ
jgi:predicted acetyltransferase